MSIEWDSAARQSHGARSAGRGRCDAGRVPLDRFGGFPGVKFERTGFFASSAKTAGGL